MQGFLPNLTLARPLSDLSFTPSLYPKLGFFTQVWIFSHARFLTKFDFGKTPFGLEFYPKTLA